VGHPDMHPQEPEHIKLSLNALLMSPAKTRWFALRELWMYRGYWRLANERRAMRAERDKELYETLPIVIVLSLVAGVLIFVVLPSSLKEQSNSVLVALWPMWVVQAAPMICAQSMAMQNAPDIALRLAEDHHQGKFSTDLRLRSQQVARLAVPWIVAHACVCAAATCLLVLFSLCFGLLAGFVLAVGDLRTSMDIVFASVSPLVWLRASLSSLLLGAVCVLAAVLYAWPTGTSDHSAKLAHRTGLRAMLTASIACAGTGMFMNWVAGLLGWNGLVA
jgi:Permease MlaE